MILVVNEDLEYAITSALADGKVDVVKALLGHPAPTLCLDGVYEQVAELGLVDIMEMLLADPRVDVGGRYDDSIWLAAAGRHKGVLAMLLADGRPPPTAHKSLALRAAVRCGYADIVTMLLADGRAYPQLGVFGTVLMTGTTTFRDTVEVLLTDPRTDSDGWNNSVVKAAFEGCPPDIMERVLASGNVDWDGAPLQEALGDDYEDVADLVLNDGHVDPVGFNAAPILLAARWGHTDTMAALLADERVNLEFYGSKALRIAKRWGHADVVALLKADPRVRAVKKV